MRILGLIFVVIVIGFSVGIMALNAHTTVNLDIFGQKINDISLSLVCFYTFIAGMVFILVFALADEIVLRTNLRRISKENNNLKKELDALRNLPFEEER